jgi:hypothetical protein
VIVARQGDPESLRRLGDEQGVLEKYLDIKISVINFQ